MATFLSRARAAMVCIEPSSPAWPPQAMLAEVMIVRSSRSVSSALGSSPRSQLRSQVTGAEVMDAGGLSGKGLGG